MYQDLIVSCFILLICHFCPATSDTTTRRNQYEIPEKCRKENDTVKSVVCSCNNTEVKDILYMMPSNIQRLRFDLDSHMHEHDPIRSIDLRYIAHLKDLTFFQLSGGYSTNSLFFNENTFENITEVRELHINVMIFDTQFDQLTKYMKYLEILDLSGTSNSNINIIRKAVAFLNKTSLNVLMLSSIQISGLIGYSDALNISSFFSTPYHTLEHLDLSRNMFGVIYPSIITMLPNLKTLDISHNSLLAWPNDPLLIEMLLHPTLEVMNMENQGAGYLANNEEIISISPTLRHISPGTSQDLTIIQKVLVCINSESHGNFSVLFDESLAFCSTIRCIGLTSSHILQDVPCEAFGNYSNWFDSSCPYFIRFPIIKRLKQFIAGDLNWVLRPTPRMSQHLCLSDTTLTNVSFGQNANWIQSNFIYDMFEMLPFSSQFKYLEEVSLQKNNLATIPRGYLPNLQKVDLTGNHVDPSDVNLCEMYPNLTYLALPSNNISKFHADFISNCKFLEYLDLSQNTINLTHTSLSVIHNTLLRTLNLNQNTLDTLPSYFTKQLETIVQHQSIMGVKSKLNLIFGDNKLICQCNSETIEFITWFKSTAVGIPDKDKYSCSGSRGEVFLISIDVDELQQTCFPSKTKLIVESVLTTFAVIIGMTVIAALYRYRWRLQYRLTKLLWCKLNKEYITIDDDTDEVIKYDAFVSYCAEDRFWVHDCLMKTLESDKYGLKLCIHYRDFPLGEDISSVIVKSIRQSGKLLIVLSECSIGRPWCQFEFQVALSEAVRRGTKLAVIKLGQFSVEELDDDSVAWVLDNHTYLQWHENESAQKVFWFKLLRHLYDDNDGTCCFSGSGRLNSNDVGAFAESNAETQPLII